MTIEALIKQKVIEQFSPEYFELVNESDKHAGHAGDDGSGQTHFRLEIVSYAFKGCNRIQSHRLVYEAIKDLFSKGLHAISINAKSPPV